MLGTTCCISYLQLFQNLLINAARSPLNVVHGFPLYFSFLLLPIKGSWRKITVTDQLPLRRSSTTTAAAAAAADENKDVTVSAGSAVSEPTEAGEKVADCVGDERSSREMLLPRTANTTELWPAIITKAILKVAALEYVYCCSLLTPSSLVYVYCCSLLTPSSLEYVYCCSVLYITLQL